MRKFNFLAPILWISIASSVSLRADCWTLYRVTLSTYMENGVCVVEDRTEVIGTWCSSTGGGAAGTSIGGAPGPNAAALALPAAQLLIQAKDCVQTYIGELGYGTDPTNSQLAIQGPTIVNQAANGINTEQPRWLSMGAPFTYRMSDGGIGIYWDSQKINSYSMDQTMLGRVGAYRTLISDNTGIVSQQYKQAAIDKINQWQIRAGGTTGVTALVNLALGQSLGSTLTDENYLMGHELGHAMALTQAAGKHPEFWIDDNGKTRMDAVQSSAANPDTFGILLSADSKARSEGTTVSQALSSMGVSGLAGIIAARFAASGGC